ncbi:MAG: UDP-N-acetylglucosamine 2-epimerase (non-hydrolyzing), partial [Sphingomicrobium sp.]
MKLAPVAHALRDCDVPPTLVLTGQHPDLEVEEFGLEAYPGVRLGCPGDEDPHRHVRMVTAAMLPLLSPAPDLLVVQGDTSSALGAALAGALAEVPIAHVEAGLRTHDPRLPWPEEEFRTAIDARADLLFAPTERAAANLRTEGLRGEVHMTGNTGIDALIATQARLPAQGLVQERYTRILVTCHRRESWGEGLKSIAAALIEIARDYSVRVDFVLHPNPHVAATMRQSLDSIRGISLIPPCTQSELVRRMREADLVLSDSGGIQEEATALGAPLLVLREKTERPEALASGNARLVGTSAERIVAEVRRLLANPSELLAMALPAFPFGDGHAAPQIARVIKQWLDVRHS